jgi:glycosyltransferase involved in cell wall biosynthesis
MKIDMDPPRTLGRRAACAVTTIQCEVVDRLRAAVRTPVGNALIAASRIAPGTRRRMLLALAAARYRPGPSTFRALAGFGSHLFTMCSELVRGQAPPLTDLELKRVLVLKSPRRTHGRIERGVVLIKFTGSFGPVFAALHGTGFFERYRVVLEPSWSGYALPEILCWLDEPLADAVVVQTFDPRDRALFEALGLAAHVVPVGPGSWADYRKFRPLEDIGRRPYAAIYVANYTWMKRLHVYMRLVRRLAREGHRCALVCGSFGGARGGARETVIRLAQYHGVQDALDFHEDISHVAVVEMLNRSMVSVLLSRKEGMNRGISESLFCDVPVVVLEENVGNHNCIDRETGLVATERDLYDAVCRVISRRAEFAPRRWALQRITPERSTAAVEDALKARAANASEPWTEGIAVKVNAPEAMLFEANATFPTFAELLAERARDRLARDADVEIPARRWALRGRAPLPSNLGSGVN